ncbi:MAG: hypothetical protein BGP04_12990 [Rhizobiales bacterium 62-17]|nr:MAG: hypothetical protein BGP04_12990 [Rhizobiales bacterium 62-17]
MPGKSTATASVPSQSRAPLDLETKNLSPLDVMLRAMREKAASGNWDAAASLAKDVAPYVHPKLASLRPSEIDSESIKTLDLSHATEEQLAALEQLFGSFVQGSEDSATLSDDFDERGESGEDA